MKQTNQTNGVVEKESRLLSHLKSEDAQHILNASQARTVTLLIFIIFIGIFSVYGLSFQITTSFEIFRNLQLTAALLAGIAAVMALIKFYTRRDDKYLFIGCAFLGVAALKMLQAVPPDSATITNTRILFLISTESWGVTRFFLATFLTFSLYPWIHTKIMGYSPLSRKTIYALLFVVLLFNSLAVTLLPLSILQNLDIYATVLLTFTLGGYLLKGLWRQKYFEYMFILSVLVGIIAGLVYSSSTRIGIELHSLAQLFETISYSFVVVGLLISMFIAYREVEETKDNTNAILKSIGDGVFVVDTNGIVITVNKIAEQLAGLTTNAIIGKHYHEVFKFLYEEDLDKPYPSVVEKVLHHEAYKEDATKHTIIESKNGTVTSVLLNASPVKDRGRIIGCVVVMNDVAKQREIEKTKDNFLSLAAHQLGTPLGAIRWHIELLLSGDGGKLPKEAIEMIKQMQENNQRMVLLVEKLLEVSRIDQKSIPENPKATNLEEIITRAIKELSIHSFKKQVKVIFNKPKSPFIITVDPILFYDVINNLLSNAIKYNKQGGTVTVSLEEKGSNLELVISDTGVGIPKKDQDKIFSKFFRATNARAKTVDGTGLGLYVVKSYIESWGGRVSFVSRENEGSTFTLIIPKKPILYRLSAHFESGIHSSSHNALT